MGWLVLIGIVFAVWSFFGTPTHRIANWLWPYDAAPWEDVDAFYYPDGGNLLVHEEVLDVGSVGNCRTVVRAMAAARGDPRLERGDYECGVGRSGLMGSIYVYRTTAR